MTNRILAILRSDPSIRIISVSNMDGGEVECPPDNAANRAENTTGGANMRAVAAIAAAVAQEFPHVFIETLACKCSRSL